MEYQATALGNDFENNRKAGKLVVSAFSVNFYYEGGHITWHTSDVQFSIGGAGNNFVFLNNPRQPSVTLYTSDKKILKDPDLHKSALTNVNHLKTLTRQHQWRYAFMAIVVVVLLSPVVLFFSFRTQVVKKIADQLPPSVEQTVGKQLYSALVFGKEIAKDSAINAQLQLVVQPLLVTTQSDGFTFNFSIVEDTTVNAFALPGGYVVIHSGLIDKADNWNEVLAVLAHEIAHVRLRHHLRGIINSYGVSFLASAFLGDLSTVMNVATTIGGNLESLMYSRRFEFEADNNGWDYLEQSRIDPQGMITFFQKLQAISGHEKLEKSMSLVSTHPATADRIANLKKKEISEKAEVYIQPAVDLTTFKLNMKQLFKLK